MAKLSKANGEWFQLDTGTTHAARGSCTVEVVERADDPSRDEIGTVAEIDGVGVPFVKVRSNRWEGVGGGLSRNNDDMKGRTVTGAVPGTPAAAHVSTDELFEKDDRYDRKPRIFRRGDTIPADIQEVRNAGGLRYLRVHPNGWHIADAPHPRCVWSDHEILKNSPVTEVVGP